MQLHKTMQQRKMRVKAEVWFDVYVNMSDYRSAAHVLNDALFAQCEESEFNVLPPIVDWIVSEPKDEGE